jgi:hypothetical protein
MNPYCKSLYAIAAILVIGIGFSEAALAQSGESAVLNAQLAITVPISGPEVAYGDLIDFDGGQNSYFLSQYEDDPRVYGVAQESPPVVLESPGGDVPLMRSGWVLVNVTLENGPIAVGDGIIASSIPGKGMRAGEDGKNIIGFAREAFTGEGSSTPIAIDGKTVGAGTVVVDIVTGLGAGANGMFAAKNEDINCDPTRFTCQILQKINAAPLVTLTRYLIAAGVALGSLYLAFHSFMSNAVNGVISVGRNPRAKAAIQAMVIFNALLAGTIAAVGLAIGLAILFVPIG